MYIFNPTTDEYEVIKECINCHLDIPSSGYDLCDDCSDYFRALEEEEEEAHINIEL